LFILGFNFVGNFFGFFIARLERSARKIKKQWIMKRNPSILSYQSAADTLYEPSALSVISTDRLAEAFIRIDRQLRDGFSRILLITVLEKVTNHIV
jgi:hypothetical protein